MTQKKSTSKKATPALVEQSLQELATIVEEYDDLMGRLSGGTASEWKMREVVQDFMVTVHQILEDLSG